MSRATTERRRTAEERWPGLYLLLTRYFGAELFHQFDTLIDARRAAVAAHDIDGCKQLVREWCAWNIQVNATEHIRATLDAYDVELDFPSEGDARAFMGTIYDELIVAIRKQDAGWRP